MPTKNLFLLDAYALIYRSYYAFIRNPRYNSKGLNTSAIFGFVNTLDELLRKENPTHIAVVFDLPFPTFRHNLYKEYKANREEMPEDIKKSIPYIKDLIKAFNIPVIEVKGYEADDVIGTLAKKAENKGYKIFMMSSDKDFCQLISDNIFLYKPKRLDKDVEILGPDEVRKNFKIDFPIQVIDILALWGDKSDNIPGVPGIGEKTAKKLVSEFGSIEGIFNNINKLKDTHKENILNLKKQIELAKTLATIVLDVPVELEEEQFAIKEPDKEALKSIFEELEFRSLIKRILYGEPGEIEQSSLFDKQVVEVDTQVTLSFDSATIPARHSVPRPSVRDRLAGGTDDRVEIPVSANLNNINTVEHNYFLIDTIEKRKELIDKLNQQQEFCFDTETTGLDVNISEIVGLSFSFKDYEAFYVPIPVNQSEAYDIVREFKEVFENNEIKKIGQNIKYDISMLKWYGVDVNGELFDTMLAHYLIQPELAHNLNYLSEQYLNYTPVSIESLIGKKGKNQLSMRFVAIAQITEYACEDADITWQLKQILEKELKEKNVAELFEKIEMPLVNVLVSMEKSGVKLNVQELNSYSNILKKEIIDLEKDIIGLAGVEFNISSPKQLGEVLFAQMKIVENPKKTKTKQYSTSEDVLAKLADKHKIIPKILEFRSLNKLLTTYVDALPKLINNKTGKIHTSFNQAITATGRLSSNKPNVQNIPVREEKGREIRKAFIPSDNEHVFLSADYSQIELRLMAYMSNDENMIRAFNNNEDIHSATAAKIYGINLSEVTQEMRRNAKTANFGIIYGISAFGLSQQLNIPRKEAKQLIDSYFESYPGIKKYMDENIQFARDNGYVETIKGRRRYLKDINSQNAIVRGIAERNAINAPIQGSAADIIKIAMINIYEKLKQGNYKTKMILQVHDELNFDVYKPELEDIRQIVQNEMQNAVKLNIPLTVDIGVGENWLEAH